MIMEDEMTAKRITKTTHVATDSSLTPRQIKMTTDEHSEVCTIRFGNSFTLGVVSPQDLMALADEIDKFAKQAYELHNPEEFETMANNPAAQSRWNVIRPDPGSPDHHAVHDLAETTFIQAGIDAREALKALKAMKSTAEPLIDPFDEYAVEAAEPTIKDEYNPEDPVNW
jgi:hypothetical protein